MANHKSSIKRIRQTETKRVANRSARTAVRTAIKNARGLSNAQGEAKSEEERLRLAKEAEKSIQRAAAKHLFHPKNAARRVSRMMKVVNAAQAKD